MAKTARNLTVAVVMTAAAMVMPQASLAQDAPPAPAPVPMSHVRARDPKVAAVVHHAFDRRPAFGARGHGEDARIVSRASAGPRDAV